MPENVGPPTTPGTRQCRNGQRRLSYRSQNVYRVENTDPQAIKRNSTLSAVATAWFAKIAAKCPRTPTRRHADTPTRRHADTPTRRHADTPTRRHADTPTRRHADTPTSPTSPIAPTTPLNAGHLSLASTRHPSWLLAIDMIGTLSASFLLQPVPVAGIMEAKCRIV
jgi:hypothetical protein